MPMCNQKLPSPKAHRQELTEGNIAMKLNAQRLIQISQFHPRLHDLWYLVAVAAFGACNEPQEIAKVYQYAMLLGSEDAPHMSLARRAMVIGNNPITLSELKRPTSSQRRITDQIREAILKSGPLVGLPKAINGLAWLKSATPSSLLPSVNEIDPWEAAMGRQPLFTPSGRASANNQDFTETTARGINHWNALYNKVSKKVVNNMNGSNPDLWYYTLSHVYGPLLSYEGVLSQQESSIVVIASLIPQDVNPQLKGHLRGALNIGCDRETVEAVRNLTILIAQWCGIEWKEDVAKL